MKALGVSPKVKSQLKYRIVRRSIDARNDIIYRYKVVVCKPEETLDEYVLESYQNVADAEPVIIIGAGPAGIFSAGIGKIRTNGLETVFLMTDFSDFLLTVDYDRTMTDPDSVVPQRNFEAIRYFMDNGGKFNNAEVGGKVSAGFGNIIY